MTTNYFRPELEPLECRDMPSATLLPNGALAVGGSDQADTIQVYISALDPTKVVVAQTTNGVQTSQSFNRAQVKSLVITGHAGDDVIRNDTALSSLIFGGKGNDTITGGSATDSVFGEEGNDRLYGREGNDLLDGGVGDDELWGMEGIDILLGRLGNDKLYGGIGNDVLAGGQGNNTVDGGAGNDRIFSGQGTDAIASGQGQDAIYSGPRAKVFLAWVGDLDRQIVYAARLYNRIV